MNISHIEEHSFIYGPGCRFVVWVQGCSIRCKGCWNQQMWSFETKTTFTVDELLCKIEKEKDSIEGITVLGGEPLDQYHEVAELVVRCKKIGLSIMIFTGYELSELIDKAMILENADILITGRYEQKNRTLYHQWIGSTNQQIHFLSERYMDFKACDNNYVEVTFGETGQISIYGFPEKELINYALT